MRTTIILRPAANVALADFMPLLVEEEKALWAYMADGTVRSIHYAAEAPGTIVIDFETETGDAARELAAAFPLVRAGLLEVEALPLAPYQGLAALFAADHEIAPNLPLVWTGAAA